MARKPRDYDAELQALTDKTKRLKARKVVQLGELVQVIGADALPIEALAGALLAAIEQSKHQPEVVARWTERGQAFFQQPKRATGKPTGRAAVNGGTTPALVRAAE